MSNRKTDKASRGRHAGEAASSNGTFAAYRDADPSVSSQTPHSPSGAIPNRPLPDDGTVAMPYGARGFIPANPLTNADTREEEPVRRRGALRILGIVLGIIAGLLLLVYVAGAIFFVGRFMPNTTLGSHDVSLKTATEVQSMLSDALDSYVLTVSGEGFSMDLSARDANVKLDGESIVDDMLSDTNPWLWPVEITKQRDETEKLAASYNESGLDTTVRTAIDNFNATATDPANATIAFNQDIDAFTVQPETVGTTLDADAVVKVVDEAVVSLQPAVRLTSDELVKPTVLSTDPQLKNAADAANQMIVSNMQLTMGGTVVGSVTPQLVSSWVRLGDDLSATLDDDALTTWVDGLVDSCTTVGTTRTYTRSDGKAVTVEGGVYGWKVDRDSLLSMVKEGVGKGTVGTFDVPCATTGTAYNGAGARDWGARYCDIDLSEQHARFYDETGALVWESDCVSGIPDGEHNTPTGVYWVNRKASPSKLIGYENGEKIYESTVQYWMPFVSNTIGLHDADWQSAFGGTRYRDGYGSHGCVNLPTSKAASLYGIIQSGDVVVCHW